MKIGIATLALSLLLLAGCSSETPAAAEESLTMCSEPRPEICTREYMPVCGEHRDGSRKTHSTGCTACSDPEVVGHEPGACPD